MITEFKIAKLDGTCVEFTHGGTPEQAADAFMKTHGVAECNVTETSSHKHPANGTYLARAKMLPRKATAADFIR